MWPEIFNSIYFTYFIFARSRVRVMVFNATFNNISDISWQSLLLMEETGVSGENHRPVENL
jgi:hypothetical protein